MNVDIQTFSTHIQTRFHRQVLFPLRRIPAFLVATCLMKLYVDCMTGIFPQFTDDWNQYNAAYYVNPCFNIYHLTDYCPFLWDNLVGRFIFLLRHTIADVVLGISFPG